MTDWGTHFCTTANKQRPWAAVLCNQCRDIGTADEYARLQTVIETEIAEGRLQRRTEDPSYEELVADLDEAMAAPPDPRPWQEQLRAAMEDDDD